MTTQQIVVHGHVTPEGGLQLDERIDMPPGPVYVTVQTAPSFVPKRDTMEVLREIWAERERLGLKGRAKDEIDAEIDAMRDEDEQRMREIEAIPRPSAPKE